MTTIIGVAIHEDVAEDESDRYGIYTRSRAGERRELSQTSREGIGVAIVCHFEDGDITSDDPVGILDRKFRTWIVNPWASGR